jgi:chemotaxis protein methyltransferase CheR
MIIDISDSEVDSLTQSILIRYGIDFTCYEPKSLKRRIIRLMNNLGLTSSHDLWLKFLHDRQFIKTFMNEISVGMTSMFRDPILWKKLKERLKALQSKEEIVIWHSGCSTGEEVYSLGIILNEINLIEKSKAHCTDINERAISEASKGVYHKIKMIENENNYREYNAFGDFSKYYQSTGTHVRMNLELIRHAQFYYHHLVNDPFPVNFDLIFCRNVMIYFDTEAKMKLLDKFYQALKPGGYLIIGFFDTMGHLMNDSKFRLIDEEAKIFSKV